MRSTSRTLAATLLFTAYLLQRFQTPLWRLRRLQLFQQSWDVTC
jgi:hypothetical protein